MGVGDHGGDDGVVWPFAGGEDIRVSGFQTEIGAAVLKCEATAAGDDAGSESAVVADYKGTAVAFGIGDGEVYRVGRSVRR